jgi:short-subunit dehydrogenase
MRYAHASNFSSKKGLILNMGSFAGAAPTPMLAVYSGSKAYLRTWSNSLTAELAPKGVVVEHVNTYYVVRPFPSYLYAFSFPFRSVTHQHPPPLSSDHNS